MYEIESANQGVTKNPQKDTEGDMAAKRSIPSPLPGVPAIALRVVATILFRARDNAAKHLATLQDVGGFGIGSVAYDLCVAAIRRAAASGQFPWLTIESPNPEFVFAIYGVKFKFFRGDEGRGESARHAAPSLYEQVSPDAEEISFPEWAESFRSEGVHRIIIRATPKGFPLHVIYARVTSDGQRHDETPLELLMPSSVNAAFDVNVVAIVDRRADIMKSPKTKRKPKPGEDEKKRSEGES